MRGQTERILLAHGGGGSLTQQLLRDVIFPAFNNPFLGDLSDAVILPMGTETIAFTTDSFVVSPHFFPGGDIGRLAVAGTVNDLAVSGARPQYLSCSFILEEGLPMDDLRTVVSSMAATAVEADVVLVAGDTKVVERGAADGIFITTTGVGEIPSPPVHWDSPQTGDRIIVNGTIGDHGLAVLAEREKLGFSSGLSSDCAPLNHLVRRLLDGGINPSFLRDATRGGVAGVLNEFADREGVGVVLYEESIPLSAPVRSLSEILGIDPLYAANEGKVVAVVPEEQEDKSLGILRDHPLGRDARTIGEVDRDSNAVLMETALGVRRVIETPSGEQLPRIC